MTAAPAGSTPTDDELAGVLLQPVRGTNAFEATVEQLARAIRLGVFADGAMLPPERELASTMNVSRTTLREAIAALRQAGLVSTHRGRRGGTVVTQRSVSGDEDDHRAVAQRLVEAHRDAYRDTLVIRRVVEPGAAYLAAERELTQAQRDGLVSTLTSVSTAADRVAHRQADGRLHLTIAKLSGSPRLVSAVADVQRELSDMLSAIPVLAVNIAHSNAEHRQVVDAILRGDADRARMVMETHCDATAALLRGLLGMPHTSPRRDDTLL